MKTLAEAKRRIRPGTRLRVEHFLRPHLSRETVCLDGTGPTNIVTACPGATPTQRSWYRWGKASELCIEGNTVTVLMPDGTSAFAYHVLDDAPCLCGAYDHPNGSCLTEGDDDAPISR